MLCDVLENKNMPQRGLRPIVVLLSDGEPNDTWEPNLEKFLALPWGRKATKIAVAIGNGADKKMLARFTTDPELVLNANSATSLKNIIKWTSTLVTHNSKQGNEFDKNGKRTPIKINIPSMLPAYDKNADDSFVDR